MARQSHGGKAPVRAALSIALVMFLAGVLFTANARLAQGEEDRHPGDFDELVAQESARGDDLLADVQRMRTTVEELSEAAGAGGPQLDAGTAERAVVLTGTTPVVGDGVRVTLQDAPRDRIQPEWAQPDDLVVHQQDLDAVINALWSGGAEAMTLQGQRVTMLSAFRCVGNVLLLHGRVYSPPYTVEAVGSTDQLAQSLYTSEGIGNYLDAVEVLGLGWQVDEFQDVTMPAYTGSQNLEFARVPEGTDIYQ
jgi:uncharacterized protein YlxW (UPF0749 family)